MQKLEFTDILNAHKADARLEKRKSDKNFDEFVKLDRGEQIFIFEEFAKKNIVNSPELVRSMASTGNRPKYFLFADSCPDASPKDRIVYSNDHYCLYRSSFWPMREGTNTLFEQ